MKSHQDTTGFKKRLVLRFASTDKPASVLFSCGRLDAGNATQQVHSVSLHSSCDYIASEEVMKLKPGHPHDIFHNVLPPNQAQPG